MKKYNFFAGPAILADSVIAETAKSVQNFAEMGLSLLEISHRSSQFAAVMEEAEALTKELLGIGDDHAVLFLTGGASSQFYMGPMNLLADNQKAAYINTGTWSTKAIKEVGRYGKCEVIASSEDKNFTYIPKDYKIDSDNRYLHITSNNTIFGTEYQTLPDTTIPLVADMSSNIFSRPVDLDKYDLIYAGAQKNLGPAGVTLVIVRKSALGKTGRDIPTMLNYSTHIAKGSAFNTPPVLPIYVSMLTLRWIKANGGVEAMEARNTEKADALYGEIDRNSLFQGTAEPTDRSKMNVCFRLQDQSKEPEFLDFAENRNLIGLKGHRSVGGFRASIYNAMGLDGVQELIKAMQEFEKKHG